MEQTIIPIGNSSGLIIPAQLLKQANLKSGSKVFVETTADGDLVIKTAAPAKKSKPQTSKEFKKWLNEVLVEDAEILDELSVR